jgi:glycosyltransferase involved in cell wall biosynthesis
VANSRSAVGELLDENGLKRCGATAKDEFEFAEKISLILRGPSLRLAARNRALEYSWDRTVQELLKLGATDISEARAA